MRIMQVTRYLQMQMIVKKASIHWWLQFISYNFCFLQLNV